MSSVGVTICFVVGRRGDLGRGFVSVPPLVTTTEDPSTPLGTDLVMHGRAGGYA
jgi:hypothetical protein